MLDCAHTQRQAEQQHPLEGCTLATQFNYRASMSPIGIGWLASTHGVRARAARGETSCECKNGGWCAHVTRVEGGLSNDFE
eukprot:6184923-Pleurochrysis_carterae.AAC.2